MAKLGKTGLINLFRDLARKPITDSQARTLIESLWRDPILPTILPFETDTPHIPDYSIYAQKFGSFPDVKLWTIDEAGNMLPRPELPYFIRVNGEITRILFTAEVDGVQIPLPDGIQVGYITIKK